jgi:hypothetical protein
VDGLLEDFQTGCGLVALQPRGGISSYFAETPSFHTGCLTVMSEQIEVKGAVGERHSDVVL